MSYEEFQQMARLYIIGALDEEEQARFDIARALYGKRAEAFIDECQKFNALFALSLLPSQPSPATKRKLLARIRAAQEAKEAEEDALEPQRYSFGWN